MSTDEKPDPEFETKVKYLNWLKDQQAAAERRLREGVNSTFETVYRVERGAFRAAVAMYMHHFPELVHAGYNTSPDVREPDNA